MTGNQRKLGQIPIRFLAAFIVFLALQIFYHHTYNETSNSIYSRLDSPLDAKLYRAFSFGSEQLLSYLLLIRVQLHDNQKGQHISYTHLNYSVLSDWLMTVYDMNPSTDYPAFLASRVYSNVPDEAKIRQMVELVEKLFNKNPQQHWRRMTEACLLLKHQLHDLSGALKIAEQIADLPASIKMPFWARDMRLILLDELNQLESAQILISSMLQSGEVKDHDELRFLQDRLLKIQQSLSRNKQMKD